MQVTSSVPKVQKLSPKIKSKNCPFGLQTGFLDFGHLGNGLERVPNCYYNGKEQLEAVSK